MHILALFFLPSPSGNSVCFGFAAWGRRSSRTSEFPGRLRIVPMVNTAFANCFHKIFHKMFLPVTEATAAEPYKESSFFLARRKSPEAGAIRWVGGRRWAIAVGSRSVSKPWSPAVVRIISEFRNRDDGKASGIDGARTTPLPTIFPRLNGTASRRR